LLLIDSLKLRLACKHFENDPDLSSKWTSFLMEHAMHRPTKYSHSYESVEDLLEASAGNYVQYETGNRPPRALFSCYNSLAQAIEDAQDTKLPLALLSEAMSKLPLSCSEVIARYEGPRDATHWFLCDHDAYCKLARNRATVKINRGYLYITTRYNKLAVSMHVNVLNRYLKRDEKVVDHLNCCRVDNRRRNLEVKTHSENNRNVRNVKVYKHWNKWRIHIQINKRPFRIPMNTKVEAQIGRKYLTANIEFVQCMVIRDAMRGPCIAKWLEQELRDRRLLD
jgi:hypothetical protein